MQSSKENFIRVKKSLGRTYLKTLEGIYACLPEPSYTKVRNLKLFEWMNQNAEGKDVLNLGSGVGAFDHHLSKEITPVNLDIDLSKPGIHLIADAHVLPFKDESFDIVYSIAVLEHVRKPWIVADEIFRILRKGGCVVLELPFLNVIHDEHDYFRFTNKGIRSLFDESRFDVVFEQVGSGGGSFFSIFFFAYFRQFIWHPLRPYWDFSMKYVASMLKYLDVFIDKSHDLHITANSFTFIGRKQG